MHYTVTYHSPVGNILLACDHIGLIGLWFEYQKYFSAKLSPEHINVTDAASMPFVLAEAIRWLDIYFSGINPDFTPPVHLSGTPFQLEVWSILQTIPYGATITYGKIASILAKQQGLISMSAQAVGNAVGRNPVSIIVPCHRVIGANGKLTGYAGGIDKKRALLALEGSL